ncbi:hypothetical protein QCB45_05955 [Thiomicrorhabdus sp. ZW0627]|uniref:hypothetical protein n=1 Tax=Thiomicrorhabdus sp. ZW0627 TaxID=3039774 RepID=UPI0024370054|nr:hypothetical protein [Thiomicrorhabdus sp. ZW0627]MDG6773868.1 hypothetical protein [Thiomicrorhabdus sp. ZW0627]
MTFSVRFIHMIHLTLLTLLLSSVFPVHANEAEGDKVIRFSGQLQASVPKRQTLKTLERNLPIREYRLYNPWEKSTDNYSGVLLTDLVAKYATPETKAIRFRAIDDYEVTFKKAEWNDFRILLATRKNGRYMTISEKGPLYLVFPDYKDVNKDYEMKLYQWAWMINRIEFK